MHAWLQELRSIKEVELLRADHASMARELKDRTAALVTLQGARAPPRQSYAKELCACWAGMHACSTEQMQRGWAAAPYGQAPQHGTAAACC